MTITQAIETSLHAKRSKMHVAHAAKVSRKYAPFDIQLRGAELVFDLKFAVKHAAVAIGMEEYALAAQVRWIKDLHYARELTERGLQAQALSKPLPNNPTTLAITDHLERTVFSSIEKSLFFLCTAHVEELFRLIGGAKESLDIALYVLSSPDMVNLILEAPKRNPKLAIRVVCDFEQLSM